jgi:hypothetical protein
MKARKVFQSRKPLIIGAIIAAVVAGIAGTAFALLGGTVPNTAGVTYTVPTSHLSDGAPLNVTLGTYPSSGSSTPTLAILTGSLAARSTTGEEHVHCDLTIGSAARVIGSSDQAGTGANLPSTGYQQSTIAITGTYTAALNEVLKLSCTTNGVSDAILTNAHVVLNKVASQSGGV